MGRKITPLQNAANLAAVTPASWSLIAFLLAVAAASLIERVLPQTVIVNWFEELKARMAR